MNLFKNAFGSNRKSRRQKAVSKSHTIVEGLEERLMLTADPLPVLLVIADQRDFYYQEYNDTRTGLEQQGVQVEVAAATTSPSIPHAGTGQASGSDGMVIPDVALADVDASSYSAIVFVGGWGSSMYQYAFSGTYSDTLYNGDATTKQVTNELINEFIADDKYVAAICHGTTVLAWARVDGVSPLSGKQVSVPYIGSPGVYYEGNYYGNYQLGQYEQIAVNGGLANTVSGQYGDPATVADDVVVDGRIITGENYDSALYFGFVIAQEVKAHVDDNDPPVNEAPVVSDAFAALDENSAVGTPVGSVVFFVDGNAGQAHSFAIVGGNTNNAFAIDSATGQVTVANSAAINYEAQSEFQLVIEVSDNGTPSMSGMGVMTIQINDLAEGPVAGVSRVGKDLVVQGSSGADVIYLWSGSKASQMFVWMNDVSYGPFAMPSGGHVRVFAGLGNDQVYASDARMGVRLFGEEGNDLITGGSANDLLDGGDGMDRLWGGLGDDLILGGDGDDYLYGREGNDVLVGGRGSDYLDGDIGRDVLLGGEGRDYLKGAGGEDLLIGGTTSYDNDNAALASIQSIWMGRDNIASRLRRLAGCNKAGIQLAWGRTVQDDGAADTLWGGEDPDLVFATLASELYLNADDLQVAK